MQIEYMWKDSNSGGGGCPAIYRAPDGYVLQGRHIDAETRAQLRDVAVGEDAVFVPANVIDRLVAERLRTAG